MLKFRRFVASLAFVSAIAGSALLTASPAKATMYNYDFTSTDNTLFATGIITVDGSNQIIGITSTITGLVTQNTVGNGIFTGGPVPVYSPDGQFIYNNTFYYPTPPYVDTWGVLFSTLQNPGHYWNLFDAGAGIYWLYESTDNGYLFRDGLLTVSQYLVSQTPLPAALPLFLTGLGALGWLKLRRKRRATTTATA